MVLMALIVLIKLIQLNNKKCKEGIKKWQYKEN